MKNFIRDIFTSNVSILEIALEMGSWIMFNQIMLWSSSEIVSNQ